ncbi:MAG: 50S ribosomal protein L19e [Nanoarchaeota archaeon]
MNLNKKKMLAARVLGVGKNRIVFNQANLAEIKEAITRQDIKTLYQEEIITIKPVKGRKKVRRRKTKRGAGKIKMKIKDRKKEYVKITRKLRKYLIELKNVGVVNKELYIRLRKKIKMKEFKSKSNFREYLNGIGIIADNFVKPIYQTEKEFEKKTKEKVSKKLRGSKQ